MKFSALQENLKQALFAVGHVAGKNLNLPILNNVMIEALDGNIKLISTNLEIGITSVLRGKIEKEGSFTVDAKILLDYIGLLPNKKVDLEVFEDKLLVSCDNYNTKINGQSAEEYPLIPNIERNDGFRIDLEKFKEGLSQVVFATASSDSRVELTGVFMVFDASKLTLVATDSYRLAEKTLDLSSDNKTNKELRVIVPVKTMQEVLRVFSGMKSVGKDLEVYITDNQILFIYDQVEIVSRIIEGQYPDYKQIIPTTKKTKATININDFSRAVKAASLFSKSGVNDINIDLPKGKNSIVISSISGQVGENITELEAVVDGEDNGLVVNYRYLADGLNNIKKDIIEISVVDNNTPCVFRGEGNKDYLYIVMPIRQ